MKESNNSYSLVIQKAALADSGSYSVVATNEVSQSSEFLKIQVHTPPKFLRTMEKNIEVGEGGKIMFQVKVAADPPPKVRWYVNLGSFVLNGFFLANFKCQSCDSI